MKCIATRPVFALALALLFASGFSHAAALPIPAPPSVGAKAWLIFEANSGRVIAQGNENERLEPASITKLMTAYVVFSELEQGKISLDDTVTISEKAWRMKGSRMFVEVGREVRVGDLLKGMIVQSGNDASLALAEHVAGDEETFAAVMNQYATRLGLSSTRFRNSTGLASPDHYSTARDIATLAAALIRDFPDYYKWYSEREFTYNGIRQHNRNSLLWRDDAVDGLKTGYTEGAGYCLVASASRDGMRLVSVVMGMPSEKRRADASQALLNYGFRFFETHKLYARGDDITRVRIWKGAQQEVALTLEEDLYVTIPRGRYDALNATMDVPATIVAPLDSNVAVGRIRVALDEETLAVAALHATDSVESGNLWRRMTDEMRLWFE